jgi:CheY-like chemotaxis protein
MPQEILIIDDSEVDQYLAKHTLNNFNDSLNLTSAYSGIETLSLIESGSIKPDYIFLDLNMPLMDGFEFLEAYNKKFPNNHSKIVVLTSSLRKEDELQCLCYPQVINYLPKPIDENCLPEIFQQH